jgi:hypothetical protein
MCGICGVIGFGNAHRAEPFASLHSLGWTAPPLPLRFPIARETFFLTASFTKRGNRKLINLLQAPAIAFV